MMFIYFNILEFVYFYDAKVMWQFHINSISNKNEKNLL